MIDNKDEISESTYGSIRRTEDQLLNLKCIIAPENIKGKDPVQWEFSRDDKDYDSISSDIKQDGPEIQIESVKQSHRGYYRCKLNGVAFTIRLRVKGKLNTD